MNESWVSNRINYLGSRRRTSSLMTGTAHFAKPCLSTGNTVKCRVMLDMLEDLVIIYV